MHEYIEGLDCKIKKLVAQEKMNIAQRGDVNMGIEQQLHILMENRKHAMAWAEKHGHHSENPAPKSAY